MRLKNLSELSEAVRKRNPELFMDADKQKQSVKPLKRFKQRIIVDIPYELKSLNHYIGKNWKVKNAFKENIINFLYYHGLEFEREAAKRNVKIIRYMGKGKREFDFDNLVGGAKFVIDALKEVGLIYDDSPEWINVEYKQEKANEAYFRVEVS